MVFLEHKTELVYSLLVTEDTKVLVNAVDDDVWEYEYERTGSLIDWIDSWYWIYLYIQPMNFPMTSTS